MFVAVFFTATTARAEPVVPGYYRLRDEAKNVSPAELGQLLVGELNCASCHTSDAARVAPKGAPDLSTIGARATPQWIRAFLSDPHKTRPGATMPDIFHASEPDAKAGAVEFLTHFLAAQGGPIPASDSDGNTILIDQGKKLYHSVGCVACHAPEQKSREAEVVPSVAHGELAGKYTVESLSQFLLDPHKSRPAGRMPSLHLSAKEARALATYLLRAQLDNPKVANSPPLRSQGLRYKLYDNTAFPNAALATFDTVEPTSEGMLDTLTLEIPTRKSRDQFGVKFTGLIAIPRDGKYTFWTRSDDGSRLYIDDKEVVNNDGHHSPQDVSGEIELRAGDHPFTLTFFEWVGGETLVLSWQGPGIPQQSVPPGVLFKVGGRPMIPLGFDEKFKPDPQKVAMGGRMFAAMGCANCHAMPSLKETRPAKPLAELKDVAAGCLAEQPPRGVPDYRLSEEQRAFIGEALSDSTSHTAPLDGESSVTRILAEMNCYACHKRGDVGGPPKDRGEFFTMLKPFDMGDEGRLPPNLTGIGGKLKEKAMEQIIVDAKLHVRGHHMATRMPQFSIAPMLNLIKTMQSLDSDPKERPSPRFTEAAARDGRTLVGIKGLGCINCHGVAGVPSMGMPAMDLSLTAERLKPSWFHALLLEPNSKNRGTRMPAFWYEGQVAYKDIAGGTADGQIDAIWTYLSLGKSMGLPAGLKPGDAGFELVPAGEPIVHRTFMKDVGTRAILVGSPDGLHVAFDANAVRLAKAWHGKFFDAANSRKDRGGTFGDIPQGASAINLPPGPSFAALAGPNGAWPSPPPGERNVGGAFKGYRTDKTGQPTFVYRVNEVEVRETPVPVLREGGAVLVRKFEFSGPTTGLTFLAAVGNRIDSAGSDGVWNVDDKLIIRIDPKLKPTVRDSGGVKQLLVPAAGPFEVEMSW
jgi:mono/diheme cytochrome c family protein